MTTGELPMIADWWVDLTTETQNSTFHAGSRASARRIGDGIFLLSAELRPDKAPGWKSTVRAWRDVWSEGGFATEMTAQLAAENALRKVIDEIIKHER